MTKPILQTICLSVMMFACTRTGQTFPFPAQSTPHQQEATESRSGFERAFSIFSEDPHLRNAQWAFYLSDVTRDVPLAMHNSEKAIVPASTQKLVTSISALFMLGPGYTYHTDLQHDGSIEPEGILHGNLFIKGSGDPSLGSAAMSDTLSLEHVFAHFLDLLREKGIKQVAGHIVADETIFDQEIVPRKWLWEDMGNYFGAGSSGLSVNENAYTVYFRAGAALGDRAHVLSTRPVIPGMSYINQVTTGERGSGDQVYIFGAPYIQERLLTGSVPLGATNFPVRGSIPEPPLFMAAAFRNFLIENGIEVAGESHSWRSAGLAGLDLGFRRVTLGGWASPPLFEIVFRTNQASVNTYAENLLKTIGKEVGGRGDLHTGIQAIRGFWQERGIDLTGMSLHDGSGLSPSNRLTARQLGQLLEAAARDQMFPALLNSLPLAGFSGSLANHFRDTPSEGILRAKSGYLGNVRAYAGYTNLQNGNLAAFVLIVNDYDGSPAVMREKMFLLMDAITRH